MELYIAEKPSVGRTIASAIGANERRDGYWEGNGRMVSWCIGHLVALAMPEALQRFAHSARKVAVHRRRGDEKAV